MKSFFFHQKPCVLIYNYYFFLHFFSFSSILFCCSVNSFFFPFPFFAFLSFLLAPSSNSQPILPSTPAASRASRETSQTLPWSINRVPAFAATRREGEGGENVSRRMFGSLGGLLLKEIQRANPLGRSGRCRRRRRAPLERNASKENNAHTLKH